MFRFHKGYLALTVLLFLTEVAIALFAHDRFMRPVLGDFLVVILIYCFCKTFLIAGSLKLAIGVLLFSYAIEVLQYLNIVKLLGLQSNTIARVIIGTSFGWEDIMAYTLGITTVVIVEKYRGNSASIQ